MSPTSDGEGAEAEIRLALELDPTSRLVSGRVRDRHRSVAFRGWLELAALIEASRRADAAGTENEAPSPGADPGTDT